MHSELPPVLTVARINGARPLDADLSSLEISANAEGRAGSALAFTAMTGHDRSGIT